MRFCLFVLFLLAGCATSPSNPASQPTPVYELTLSGVLDGIPFSGVAMGNSGPSHTLTIQSDGTIPYVIGQTCHRFDKHEKAIDQGWIKETKSWSYAYTQAPTIEDTGDCPLRICAYETTVGTPPVQCAVVDFKNPRYTHPARNICNGSDAATTGKMLCHTKTGLIERVQFDEPMRVAGPVKQPDQADETKTYTIPFQCEGKFIDSDNMLFQYVMPASECYIIFYAAKPPHARTKLTVIPYNTPLMSGGQ